VKKRIGMNLEFAEVPAAGLAINYDGQRYDLIGNDGLLTWCTHCQSCGAEFTCTSTLLVQWLTRNCEQHRAKSFAQRKRETEK
jgi:hypothetical protein